MSNAKLGTQENLLDRSREISKETDRSNISILKMIKGFENEVESKSHLFLNLKRRYSSVSKNVKMPIFEKNKKRHKSLQKSRRKKMVSKIPKRIKRKSHKNNKRKTEFMKDEIIKRNNLEPYIPKGCFMKISKKSQKIISLKLEKE